MVRKAILPSLALCFGLQSTSVLASPEEALDDWNISGYATVRGEHAGSTGNSAASPYPFEGGHSFVETNVNFSRSLSPHRNIQGQVHGLINDSDYRSSFHGVVPERFKLQYEDGESSVPFRAEVGDIYAYTSYRTFQQSLKGVQLEFQPRIQTPGNALSVLLFSGANQSFYRDLDVNENYNNGMSLLWENKSLGRISFNSAQNSRDSDSFFTAGTSDSTQWVNSIAFETPLKALSDKTVLEGEYAFFTGDMAIQLRNKTKMIRAISFS